jgi:pyruvate formate lyase activating enzyme
MPSLQVLEEKQRLRSLKEMLHQHSGPAAEALIERRDNGDVQCFACGHRCLVKPGRDGVCRVRFNENGTLLVPRGYVGALACDPIEKKPFFHVLPGSDALTFGMLGCDYHCGYCFTPDTTVLTERGPVTFAELFDRCGQFDQRPDATIGYPVGIRRTIAASGQWRRVEAVFRHRYRGSLTVVRPYYLPAVRCTPDHSIYATTDPSRPPEKVKAGQLTKAHFLAVPRQYASAAAEAPLIDVAAELSHVRTEHRVRWKLSAEDREMITTATAAGRTSRQIGLALGKSGSYVRHVRAKLARGGVETRVAGALVEEGRLRFPHERQPGVPVSLPLDQRLATLLGYYCAEGSVVRDKNRPNSYCLNFSFSHREVERAEEVRRLISETLGLGSALVWRSTTLAVSLKKASAALLFKSLAGAGATGKRVPAQLFDAPRAVAEAFLEAYVGGDGHRYANGKVGVTTVSPALAHGVAFLALQLGHLPSVYEAQLPEHATVQGRAVRRCPKQFSVVWYEPVETRDPVRRRVVETEQFHLVPLREISTEDYDGDVFNMQVEQEHNYLANFLLVSNCQNWVTSQMLRDPDAVAPAKLTTATQLVDLAVRHGAPVVASSYNEPLITSEWAVEVFKEAKGRGLRCAYISNGNGTPQVLDFIRPHVDAYKVDLKTFNPKNYRQLGGVMENVTDTIKALKERGFWVEIVTLVVPGFSDDPDDLERMADFLASVDPLMPWHMTAFHPDYKMTDGYRSTTVEDLMRIVDVGKQAGLKYLYPGNLPGQVGQWENTRCHHCDATVIKRYGFLVLENRVGADGLCPDCRKPLPGVWGKASGHGDGRVRSLL